MSRRRVVVTGLGIVSPVGNGVPEAWKNILAGQSGITRITRFDASAFSSQIAGEVKDFDPAQFIEKKEIKKMDTFIHYAVAASQLAVDDAALLLVASITTVTLMTLAVIYRPLVIESFDPGFLRALGGGGGIYHMIFMLLMVLNLVAGFQALGTLMSVGLMMLPAAAARFWARELWSMALVAALIGVVSGVAGLLLSYHLNLPSGPAIVLTCGAAYLLSVAVGPRESLWRRFVPARHLEA